MNALVYVCVYVLLLQLKNQNYALISKLEIIIAVSDVGEESTVWQERKEIECGWLMAMGEALKILEKQAGAGFWSLDFILRALAGSWDVSAGDWHDLISVQEGSSEKWLEGYKMEMKRQIRRFFL